MQSNPQRTTASSPSLQNPFKTGKAMITGWEEEH
jgi:hypothetical protein